MKHVTGGSLPAKTWRNFRVAATQGMPVHALPSAPADSGTRVAAAAAPAPSSQRGWLGGLIHNIFGGGSGGGSGSSRPAPVEQRPIYRPPDRW